jgi:D-glucosaminate-specific PTS system IIC component
MLAVALFAGFWYTIAGWRPGYSTHEIWMFPLLVALPIGLLMGNVSEAMIIGCAISAMYVGLVAPGSEMPADMSLAGLIGIPIALSIGADTGTAIAIAVPFGVLGVFLNQIRRIINAKWAHMADKYALDANTGGIARSAMLYPLLMNFVLKFPPAFIAVYFGTDAVRAIINILPAFVLKGFAVAGGIMPAIGFAVLINLIAKGSTIGFFFLGFFVVRFFGVSSIQAACIGIPLVVIITLMGKSSEDGLLKKVKVIASSFVASKDDDDDE